MAHVPVYSQETLGTCYASVGAAYYSSLVGKTCDSIDAALGTGVYYNNKTAHDGLLDGGKFCNVIQYYNTQPRGCCSSDDAYGPNLHNKTELDKAISLLESFKRSSRNIDFQKRSSLSRAQDAIAHLRSIEVLKPDTDVFNPITMRACDNRTPLDVLIPNLEQMNINFESIAEHIHSQYLDNPEELLYDSSFSRFLFRLVNNQCKSHRFATPKPLNCNEHNLNSSNKKDALDHFRKVFNGTHPKPIPISICANIFSPAPDNENPKQSHSGLNYVGDPNDEENCGNHAMLMIGTRCKSRDVSSCEFLLQNSWGASCNYYHSDFFKRCEKGKVWVPYRTIRNNIYRWSEVHD